MPSVRALRDPARSMDSCDANAPSIPDACDPRLAELLHGYRATCVIVAAIRLGLIDRLGTQWHRAADLAEELGANPPALRRLLRALAALGLVRNDGETFALSRMGGQLLSPGGSGRPQALLIAQEYLPAWGALDHSVRTGESAFAHVFGMDAWQHRRIHPELNAAFNHHLGAIQAEDVRALVATLDLSRSQVIVDVGGGQGHLLAAILARHPHARGVLFDQPHVLEEPPVALRTAGVHERCRILSGSFFDAVPAGGDTYVLQNVLHDWDDEKCMTILRNCRRAMPAGATLLLVEGTLSEQAGNDLHLVLLDLHMMAVLGGRERTREEYRGLVAATHFEPFAVTPLRGSTEVIQARAV